MLDDSEWMSRICQQVGVLPRKDLDAAAAAGKEDTGPWKQAIESVVRYTWGLAIKLHNESVPAVDLFQEGILGAMHAIDAWDPNHESRAGFQTYAGWASRQYMLKYRAEDRLIRLPIAWFQGIPRPEWIERFPEATKPALSTNTECRGEGKRALKLGDVLPDKKIKQPYENADLDELFDRFHLIVSRMEARRREVLIRRFHGETLEQVANVMGVCKERVRQLQMDAMQDINVFRSTPIVYTENVIV